MLPSYHHGGGMPGHGSKPFRRPWVPDLSGTLIAIIVLAMLLAFEHFHFQSRLSRVSVLEVSLAKQLHELQTSLTQQDEQLHRMNPKLDEIDVAESTIKRLQDEVRRTSTGIQDVKAAVDQLKSSNATGELKEITSLHGKQLEALKAQLEAVLAAQAAANVSMTALDSRVTELEANLTKLAAKLDSHNSALQTLADQMSVHQNSTLSALQQQTAAVSEALEAHRELQNSVQKLKELQTGATAGTPTIAASVTKQGGSADSATAVAGSTAAGEGAANATNAMEAGTAIASATEGGDVAGSAGGAGADDDHLTRGRTGLVLDDEDGTDASASAGEGAVGSTAAAGSSAAGATNTTNSASATAVANTTAAAGASVSGSASDSVAAIGTTAASTEQAVADNTTTTASAGTGDSTSALEALRVLVASKSSTEGDASATDNGLTSISGNAGVANEGQSTAGVFGGRGADNVIARMRGQGVFNQQQADSFERMHVQFAIQQQAAGATEGNGGADAAAAVAAEGQAVAEDTSQEEDQNGEADGVFVDEEEQDEVEGLRR